MQVSQARLDKDYWPVEIAYFESQGRGKITWTKNVNLSGKNLILVGIRNKLRRLLERVETALYGYSMTAPFAWESRASLSARLPRASLKLQLGPNDVEMRVRR